MSVTLWKRGNVYWSYVWVDGIRYMKSTGTGNRRSAELIDERYREEANLKRHGVSQPSPDMKFGDLAARFLAEGVPKPYHVDRLKVLLPFWSETSIGRITKNLAREYRQWRHREKRLTDTTVNRDLECLRHILFWALDDGLLLTNPLSRMRLERERKRKRPVMSLDEEDLLLRAAAPHLRPIIIAALDAGMRRGEILTQRWEDVDFARRLIFVSHSKTPEGEAREIPLTNRLFSLLWEMREDEGLIFTFKGQPIHSIKTAWKTALSRGEIRRYRFHDLRHSFNSRLVDAGVLREVRMSLMGHSLGDDPQATYTHVELPLKREAIRKLESWTVEQRKQLNLQEKKGGE
jgi:integrase